MVEEKKQHETQEQKTRVCVWLTGVCFFGRTGVIMLAVVGYLLETNYTPIHFQELSQADAATAASASYGAAGLYAAVAALCAARFIYLMWASRRRVQRV